MTGGRLITDGRELALGKRTTAIVEELHAREAQIESPRKGRVEITVDFSNGSLTVAVREVGESRRIE
jgi:hypothetical protein